MPVFPCLFGEREVMAVKCSSSPGEWQECSGCRVSDLASVLAGRRGRGMSGKKTQPLSP